MFLELFDGARLRHDLGEYVIARIVDGVQMGQRVSIPGDSSASAVKINKGNKYE